MDPLWLSIAFIFGFAVRLTGLPPLVGYLIAGFVLNSMGAESGEFIETVSDLGVTLLLFTIGLKLKLKNLIRREVYGAALIHMSLITLVFTGILVLAGLSNAGLFAGFTIKQAVLIAFALSFSSTVFAVKVLDDRGESTSLHGTTAIAVLIIQDLVAVIFLVSTADQLPSLWVFALPVILFMLRPLIFRIYKKAGHGELLILFGFFLALVPGAELFKLVGLKPDLGALVMGMLVSGHAKSKEMASLLMHFKDFFLIGFFLSIGLSVMPTMDMLLISLFIAILINFKVIAYFLVFTRFGFRALTSYFTSLSLANYSEFGLIVASVAAVNGWLSNDWLGVIALSLAISFIISSPLNTYSHTIFNRIKSFITRFEVKHRLLYDRTIDIGDAEILIFGMGLLGISAYDRLKKTYGQKVLGLDYDSDKVASLNKLGRNVIMDDATDIEFWERVHEMQYRNKQVKLVVLCMDDQKSNVFAIKKLKSINYTGKIAATAKHDDDMKELEKLGVDSVYNLYAEAGMGLADHVCTENRNNHE
ncbi:MAG: cation:proton antiporter family protein [Bacteroidales bacterium]|nr:cation:proton antiporter family protein [Bacteroidales bacterium]